MENLIYTFTINLMDYDYNIIESETQETKAFVTETGGLDAYIEIEGETYLLSELESESQIDECAFFTWIVVIVVIVVVYHVVTETAEQIKSKENYMYNKALDGTKDGMYYKKYITSQDIRTIDEVKFDSKEKVTFTDPITGETKKTNKFKSYTYLTKYEYIDYSPSIYDGARAGNYKFGFTFFDGVGCEVAAVYNLLIAKGNTKPLSEVIYLFEQKAIEFAFAWGHFGSNCFQIDNILDYYDIDYVQYDSFDSFKEAYDKSINKYAIMSRWNSKLLGGYHTYMIKQVTNTKTETINLTGVANSRKKSGTIEIVKIVNQMYYGYNHDYYLNEASASIYDSSNDLSFFNDGLFYIVGYII